MCINYKIEVAEILEAGFNFIRSIIKLKLQHSNGATFGQTCKFHVDFDEDDIWTLSYLQKKIGTLSGEENL